MMTSKKKKGRVIWGKPICIDQRLVFIEEKVVEEWEILVPQVIELEVNSKDGSITWKTFQERWPALYEYVIDHFDPDDTEEWPSPEDIFEITDFIEQIFNGIGLFIFSYMFQWLPVEIIDKYGEAWSSMVDEGVYLDLDASSEIVQDLESLGYNCVHDQERVNRVLIRWSDFNGEVNEDRDYLEENSVEDLVKVAGRLIELGKKPDKPK